MDINITNENSIEQQVINSNPILEAFGNAKTVKNNNSSRFGKFIQINFTLHGKIESAKISHYLLEKSRIIQINSKERSFHIFYLLTKIGINKFSSNEINEYCIKPLSHFRLLSDGEKNADEYDDDKEFDMLMVSFQKLNFSSSDKKWIFKTVMGVLYLNNIDFDYEEDEGVGKVFISKNSEDDLVKAAELLGFNKPETLVEVLIKRKIKDPLGKSIICDNSIDMCYNYKEAMAKSIYSKMFDFIVKKINSAICANISTNSTNPSSSTIKPNNSKKELLYIGLLDIFGFENFEQNSFEQLCINYANERLQNYFNLNIFKLEQNEYKAENINYSNIEFKDNQEVVELIDSKTQHSIFSLLDNQGILKTGSNNKFREDVYKYLSGKKGLGENIEGYIEIVHFAENVYYDVDSFIEKNLDQINNDITVSLQASNNKLIKVIFKKEKDSKSSGKLLSETLSAQFIKQLDSLIQTLIKSNSRYIKCIKPNDLKVSDRFESSNVTSQLLSAGVLEAIKIRKQGYSSRKTYEEFFNRYKKLTPHLDQKDIINNLCKQMIEIIFSSEDLKKSYNNNNIQFGLTKIFYKDVIKQILDSKLCQINSIEKIQSTFKMYCLRKKLLMLKIIVFKIQNKYKLKRKIKVMKFIDKLDIKLKRSVSLFSFSKLAVKEKIKNNNYNNNDNNKELDTHKEKANILDKLYSQDNQTQIKNSKDKETRNSDYNTTNDIQKMMNDIKKKKKKTINLLNYGTNFESEYQNKIQYLEEQNTRLSEEVNNLNIKITKITNDNKITISENEILKEKLKLLKENFNKIEYNDDNINNDLDESSSLKKQINDKNSEIEILNFKLSDCIKKYNEVKSSNEIFKSYCDNQKIVFDSQINELIEKNSNLSNDLLSLNKNNNILLEEIKSLKENNNNNKTNTTTISDYSNIEGNNKKYEKDKKILLKKIDELNNKHKFEVSEFARNDEIKSSQIKELLSNMKFKEDEILELNRRIRELENNIKENALKDTEYQLETLNMKFQFELKQKDKVINDIKEEFSQKISNLEKIKSVYKIEIENKDEEIAQERRYLEEKLNEISLLIKSNIELKKQVNEYKVKFQEQNSNLNFKVEQDLKNQANEIFLLKEKNEDLIKNLNDLNFEIKNKKSSIKSKNNINRLLLNAIQLKNKEVNCVTALQTLKSKNIEEELITTRDEVNGLIKEINELLSNDCDSDSSNDEEEEYYDIENNSFISSN